MGQTDKYSSVRSRSVPPGQFEQLKNSAQRAWSWVLELGLVLWITRVSVFSTALGSFLFIFVPQVRDTFLEITGAGLWDPKNVVFWATFLLSAVVFWALPVHYAARRDIQQDPVYESEELSGVARWVPRLLCWICLASIALGAYRAKFRILDPSDQPALDQAVFIMCAASILSIALLWFLWRRRDMFSGVSLSVGSWLMFGLGFVFFLLFLFPPEFVTEKLLWRAPLVPLLLGGWVPIFAWLAYQGRRYRVPFILLLFLTLEGLAYFSDHHDVRRLWVDSYARVVDDGRAKGFERESIDEAIARWKEVQGCEARAENCPRPIVIAASGGASRAGFFTAAFLGEMMDRSAVQNFQGVPNFSERVFAISTVSGSSVGAAFFLSALDVASKGEHPCKADPEKLVYFSGKPNNWRECMEQVLAGDFISPTLYGFIYRDTIRGVTSLIPGAGVADRAEVLERSWEDRFCLSTKEKLCGDDDVAALRAPFLSITGKGNSSEQGRWTPILLLNATDVETGRRVVISPLKPRYGRIGRELFPDAYDLHDMLVDETSSGPLTTLWNRPPRQNYINRDIRLSTAALLSARFPIISPPGNIRNAQDQVLTRLIDGGYFENFGAATAAEIVDQLKKAKLKPFVIEITNDPEFFVPNRLKGKDPKRLETRDEASANWCSDLGWQDPLKLLTPPIIDAPDHLLFAEIRGPIQGLLGSRGAQGGRALRVLRNNDSSSFLHVSVRPTYVRDFWTPTCEVADVSMSWWLSKHVQRYLDSQIDENCPAINIAVLKMRGGSRSMVGSPTDHCAN